MTEEQQRESDALDADIRAHQLTLAKDAVRSLLRRGSIMALENAGRLSPSRAIATQTGLEVAMKLLIELEHGHATAGYVAAIEAERAMFVLP